MVQNDTPPPAAEAATTASNVSTQSIAQSVAAIERAYPNRAGFVRRIHPIYKSYFRVNFHELGNYFQVSDSYFLTVHGERVECMN